MLLGSFAMQCDFVPSPLDLEIFSKISPVCDNITLVRPWTFEYIHQGKIKKSMDKE